MARMWENWYLGVYSEWNHPANGNRITRRFFSEKSRQIWVRSFVEESGKPVTSTVQDIVKSGVRTTYEITTESEKKIRATMDSLLFTPDGWSYLCDVLAGGYVYRQGKIAVAESPPIPPRLRQGISIWTQWMRDELIPFDGALCYLCNKYFQRSELELDHVVPVVADLELALSKSNLRPACNTCHRKKSNEEQSIGVRQGSRTGLRPERVVSISNPMDVVTFDLVLVEPARNYLAEGLVVRSSV